MNRKKFILVITMFLGCGLIASAATLTYLSNPSQAKVTVDEPPVTFQYYDEDSATYKNFESSVLDLGTFYGSDNVKWDYKVTKEAHSEAGNTDVQILGTLWGKLYCPDGISLDDLDRVTVYAECPVLGYAEFFNWTSDDSDTDQFTPVDKGNWLEFTHETKILYNQWGYKGYVELVFNQYAYGSYDVTMQIK